MKWIISTFLVCSIAASPLFARQEPADKDKPKQEEPKPKQEEPKQQPEPAKQPKAEAEENKQQKQQKAEEKQQQKDQKDGEKNAKESEKQNKNGGKPARDNDQPASGNAQQTDRGQRSAEQSGGRGQRIPTEKFQASFGREHHFRVQHLDARHRFQYGGYWFEVAQPWPAGWSYDDDCYIEDDGGAYYLVDLIHPDIHILVIVV
jgi:hypothetical protein